MMWKGNQIDRRHLRFNGDIGIIAERCDEAVHDGFAGAIADMKNSAS